MNETPLTPPDWVLTLPEAMCGAPHLIHPSCWFCHAQQFTAKETRVQRIQVTSSRSQVIKWGTGIQAPSLFPLPYGFGTWGTSVEMSGEKGELKS